MGWKERQCIASIAKLAKLLFTGAHMAINLPPRGSPEEETLLLTAALSTLPPLSPAGF